MANKDNKMKLDVSEKQGGNFIRPHFRKGYYPAKVLSIEQRKDKEGNLFVGQYGNQMIVKFQIWEGDSKGNPTVPMKIETQLENGPKMESDVELPKFVYYTYKDKETGEMRTAVTPNAAITKMFVNLGWEFDTSGIDTDEFIGRWAEVNIDDYEYEEEGVKKKASTIKDIGKFEGKLPDIEKKVAEDKKSSKSSSKAEEKYKDGADDELEIEEIDVSEDFELSEEAQNKIDTLKEQVEAGLIDQEMFEKIKADIIKKEAK